MLRRRRVTSDPILAVGIDPGLTGAIVAWDQMATPRAWTMPRMSGDSGIDWPRVREIIEMCASERAVIALEALQPMRRSDSGDMVGGRAATTAARNHGMLEGMIAANYIPYDIVSPRAWQRLIIPRAQTGATKAAMIDVCRGRFPELELAPGRRRQAHSGIADAVGLALYAAMAFSHRSLQ